jgi:hypothetical protein
MNAYTAFPNVNMLVTAAFLQYGRRILDGSPMQLREELQRHE